VQSSLLMTKTITEEHYDWRKKRKNRFKKTVQYGC
jgi:hypothetical protein